MSEESRAYRWTVVACQLLVVLVAIAGVWGQQRAATLAANPAPSGPPVSTPAPEPASTPAPEPVPAPTSATASSVGTQLPPPGSEQFDQLYGQLAETRKSYTLLEKQDIWSEAQQQQLDVLDGRIAALEQLFLS